MKKSLCLFLALLVLGSACIVSAHCVINEKRDQVELTESEVYGDKTAAEGLELTLHVTCNRRLFWDTTRTLGENAENKTEFHFSQTQEREEYEFSYSGVTVDIGCYFGIGFGGNGAELDDEVLREFHGYEDIIKDVVSRAQPGVEYTETVFLSDYMDYYPLNFYFELDAFIDEDSETNTYYAAGDLWREFPELYQWLSDYFRIPVNERYAVTVSVLKNAEGNILDIDLTSDDNYWINMRNASVITEDACYFALSMEDSEGNRLDDSLIPGGFGIYRIPFSYREENGKENVKIAEIRELENVYPFPQGVCLSDMQLSSDGGDILLVTEGEEGFGLTVLDAETVREKQKLDITEADWLPLYYYDGFMVACSNERLVLIEKTPDGEYRRAIDVDISGDEYIWDMSWRSSDMAWNGEKLAIAVSGYEQKEYYDSYSGEYYMISEKTCGCWLAVYDETGLLYCADITSSLTGGSELNNDMETRFVYNDPVKVAWK